MGMMLAKPIIGKWRILRSKMVVMCPPLLIKNGFLPLTQPLISTLSSKTKIWKVFAHILVMEFVISSKIFLNMDLMAEIVVLDHVPISSVDLGLSKKHFAGVTSITGNGFLDCGDPTMVPLTIYLDNFASNKELAYLAQRFTPEQIEDFETQKEQCFGESWCDFKFKDADADPIKPSLMLDCDNENVLTIPIDPKMTQRSERVFVHDGVNCTIKVANVTLPHSIESLSHGQIWYFNFTIFQGFSADNGTKIIGMNSGEQDIFPFFRIQTCIFQNLAAYTDMTGIYSGNSHLQAIRWMVEDNSGSSDCRDKFLIERFALSV